jgi:TRAP-type uncharacterized transport system fused permease subunit
MAYKIYRLLLWIEGLYSLVTAIWPILDIDSFMKVTGPKTDQWLVKTVSVLILSIAVFFLVQLRYNSPIVPVAILGILFSAGLIVIDFYYPSIDRISNIYMADGVVQIIFLLCWINILLRRTSIENRSNKKV